MTPRRHSPSVISEISKLRTPDLTGQRFGRLVAVARANNSGKARWECWCNCGITTIVAAEKLRRGHTQSCGCLKMERTSATKRKHGYCGTPTYVSWVAMVQRTTNERLNRWRDWGGRGIRLCDSWREFTGFLADMGERPPGTSIDRIDNDLGYEPGNCRWATDLEQSRNARHVIVVTLCGNRVAMQDACERFGLKMAQVHHKAKWWGISKTEAFYQLLDEKWLVKC